MNDNDEFDDEYDEHFNDEGLGFDAPERQDIPGEGESGGDLDPLDITNPKTAYFFLSDDVQDELQGSEKRKMRCDTCGHIFVGEAYDNCPKCFSSYTEKISNGIDSQIDTDSKPKMKCLSCGHAFQGDITDICPECYSTNTEELIPGLYDERDDYDPLIGND